MGLAETRTTGYDPVGLRGIGLVEAFSAVWRLVNFCILQLRWPAFAFLKCAHELIHKIWSGQAFEVGGIWSKGRNAPCFGRFNCRHQYMS